MRDPADYRLYVLGSLRLECRGCPVKFSRRKVASLWLTSLSCRSRTRVMSLHGLLWGDYTDAEARSSLRNALFVLRRILAEDVLITDNQTVQINLTFPFWVDARAFEGYARDFLAAPSFDLSPAFIDLYQGDLLPDLSMTGSSPQRQRLRSLYLGVLLPAAQARSRSDYGRAIDLPRPVLAIDPATSAPTSI